MKLNTIRNQLLLAFLIFTGIIIFLSSASFWYLQKGEEIRLIKTWIDQLHLNTLSLIKYDQSFFSHETINEDFFQTGESDHLRYRKALLEDIQNNLEQLVSKEQPDLFSTSDIFFIDSLITSYDSTFSIIVEKTLIRGFKDYGLQGKMRRYATRLEDPEDGPLEMSYVDHLRRYEKDYFLKLDQFYVDELNNLSGKILNELNREPEENHEAIQLLTNYTDSFNRLVMLSRELGLEDNKGLKKQIDILSSYIATEFDSVSTNSSSRVSETLDKVKITYLIMVIFGIALSIVISYYMAFKLSRPIILFTKELDKVIDHNFEGDINLQTSTIEVLKLESSFRNMISQIRHQFGIIQENATALRIQNNELKKINSKLRLSEKNLQESSKVKDKFFSIIAHDLKGPIATQASFLNTLIRYIDGFSKEETKALAKEMFTSVNNLSTLLENLLEWSRSQMGMKEVNMGNVALADVVQRNVDLMIPRANEKEIRVEQDISQELKVFADENLVNFILRNLISNSIKFTKPGGEVRVSAEVNEAIGMVEVRVKDNGVGIDDKSKSKLFELGSKISKTGTANEKGTGLGLMLCKEFVEAQKGTIWLDSQVGIGTTFIFSLQLPKA